MSTVAAISREMFESGYFCAESVLIAAAQHYGIESEFVPAIATGFCGGMARTSGICGALTGGIMALSMLYGRRTPHDSRDDVYKLVSKLIGEFSQMFGSIQCNDLLGCDISTPEGLEEFEVKNLSEKVCVNVTERVGSIVEGLVTEHAD